MGRVAGQAGNLASFPNRSGTMGAGTGQAAGQQTAGQGRQAGRMRLPDGGRNFASMGVVPKPGRSMYDGARCHCGAVAHRFVGKRGWCLTHQGDAFAAQAVVARSMPGTVRGVTD